jgi:hypothetical protein
MAQFKGAADEVGLEQPCAHPLLLASFTSSPLQVAEPRKYAKAKAAHIIK